MQLESVAPEATTKRGPLRRFGRCSRGATTLEFALVSIPFFMLVFGIMTIALHYFTLSSLEYAVTSAARKVRTGEAQKTKLTMGDLRTLICEETSGYLECNDEFVLHVKSGSAFADLNPPIACMVEGKLTPGQDAKSAVSLHSGAGSAAVLVTACYRWSLGDSLWKLTSSLLGVSSPLGNATVLSATATFRTEPYQ